MATSGANDAGLKESPAVTPRTRQEVKILFKANPPETTGLDHRRYQRAIKGKDLISARRVDPIG
jgi:hypothetical protein